MDTVVVLTALRGKQLAKRIVWDSVDEEHKTSSSDKAKWFSGEVVKIADLMAFHELLSRLRFQSNHALIHGDIIPGTDTSNFLRRVQPRTTSSGTVEPATIAEAARHWVPIDMDRISYPDSIDPLHDPDSAVEYVVSLLPPEFHGVTLLWFYTIGMGIKPGINIRLYFWSERKLTTKELKRWLGELVPVESKPRDEWKTRWPVDPYLYNSEHQLIYVADPILHRCHDPVPFRCGIWHGETDTIIPPSIEQIDEIEKTAASVAPMAPGLGYSGHLARIGDGPDQRGVLGSNHRNFRNLLDSMACAEFPACHVSLSRSR
jgi:hypothetical protein